MAKASKPAPDAEVKKSKPAPDDNPFGKKHYEEWEVKITDKKAEKLKISRPRVLITDDQAETLNYGVTEGANTYAKMYYLPE